MHTYIHTDRQTYIHTYIHPCIHISIHTYIHTYISTYRQTDIHTYIHSYMHTYIHTSIHTYMHTYIPTYLRTYVLTYVRTYVRRYIHTYIHTYIHSYLCKNFMFSMPSPIFFSASKSMVAPSSIDPIFGCPGSFLSGGFHSHGSTPMDGLFHGKSSISMGFSTVNQAEIGGYPQAYRWMIFMEHPNLKWMMTRGTPMTSETSKWKTWMKFWMTLGGQFFVETYVLSYILYVICMW